MGKDKLMVYLSIIIPGGVIIYTVGKPDIDPYWFYILIPFSLIITIYSILNIGFFDRIRNLYNRPFVLSMGKRRFQIWNLEKVLIAVVLIGFTQFLLHDQNPITVVYQWSLILFFLSSFRVKGIIE